MPKFRDLTGETFSRLTVLKLSRKVGTHFQWLCKCFCGRKTILNGNSLVTGNTKSCGCLQKEYYASKPIKHGLTGTRMYRAWYHMLARCGCKTDKAYRWYGGRGIKVCKRWKDSFENFYVDMGECPPGYSIERINNDKGYCLANCKWIPKEHQNRNTRRSRKINFKGQKVCVSEFAKLIKMNRSTVQTYLNKDYSISKILKEKWGKNVI